MYSIDFAEHIWGCGIQSDYCMTPVLRAVCDLWNAYESAWAKSYLRDEVDG